LIATNHEKNKKGARRKGMNYTPQPLPLIVIVCNETPKTQKKVKKGRNCTPQPPPLFIVVCN
jgi:hypothetical protein